jgi:hypothetical protein
MGRGRGACCVSYAAETEDTFDWRRTRIYYFESTAGLLVPIVCRKVFFNKLLNTHVLLWLHIEKLYMTKGYKSAPRPACRDSNRTTPWWPVNKALWSLAEPIGAEG